MNETEYELIKQSGWFDADFYLKRYPDVAQAGMDPVVHYLTHGASEMRQPHPEFDSLYYVEQCLERGIECANPLLHFLEAGRALGLEPASQTGDAFAADPTFVRKTVGREFNYAYYLEQYPDVRESGSDPLAHYLQQGWIEGRNPRADFDTAYYLEVNEDVARSGINPFYHFIVAGRDEGRDAVSSWHPEDDVEHPISVDDEAEPAAASVPEESAPPGPDEFTRKTVAQAFDRDFYLSQYPDVARAKMDPLDHYLLTGWREGRDPCWAFDTSFYLEHYQDIRDADVNPFFHYLVAGKAEGRKPKDELAMEVAVLDSCVPPREAAARWRRSASAQPMSQAALLRAVSGAVVPDTRGLCVVFSHDNYLQVVGGVQNCIADEQHTFNKKSFNYIQLSPTQALPILSDAKAADGLVMTVTCNGVLVGTATLSSVAQVLVKTGLAGNRRKRVVDVFFILHSFLGHSPEAICEMADALVPKRTFFWVHDYGTVCASYTLMRNDLTFCHAPPIESQSCRLCAYGTERPGHTKRIGRLFQKLRPDVLAPSDAALAVWKMRHFELAVSHETVLAHCSIVRSGSAGKRPAAVGPIRVGFLGYDKYHKGWSVFERLASRFAGERYSFHHLGRRHAKVPFIEFTPVNVTLDDRDAMLSAARKHQLDVVIVWAQWPETFSFVTFEAIAAGAQVITNAGSGNVAAAVASLDAGYVVSDEESLHTLLEGEELRRRCLKLRRSPPAKAKLKYSGCTAAVVLPQGRQQ